MRTLPRDGTVLPGGSTAQARAVALAALLPGLIIAACLVPDRSWSAKKSGGTGAILASLVALGVGPGVEVLVPGYTFVASISAVLVVGGPRVIMPVHMLGNPPAMDAINAVAKRHRLAVLEDSAQALGATYRGRYVGTFGDIAAFSLNINTTITCGDGGLVATDDTELYERAFAYHDQGHKPLRMGLEIGTRSPTPASRACGSAR